MWKDGGSELKAFRLACGHIRVADELTLQPNPQQLYCDFCKDNRVVMEVLTVEDKTLQLPIVTTECYQVQKDSMLITLSNGYSTELADVSMIDLVKQWETQNTYPGEFFPFYKGMQLRMASKATFPNLKERDDWRKLSNGYLVTLCRNSLDDFIRTGELRFLSDAANCLAVLYTKKQIT
jgi:hypothetical protein